MRIFCVVAILIALVLVCPNLALAIVHCSEFLPYLENVKVVLDTAEMVLKLIALLRRV